MKELFFDDFNHKRIRTKRRYILMYRGLFLADIHIGALPYDQTCLEVDHLKKLLKNYTTESLLDFIIIGGDYFDKQMYTSDLYIDIAQRLMIHLLSSAKIVRVVYGTSSHDSSQYQIFEPLVNELPQAMDILDFDFRIIKTVEEEEILPGMKVLYIPEEYIYDKTTYYKDFLSKENEYAYIFGHGMIADAFRGKIKEPKKIDHTRKKAPIFNAGELSYACFGDVLFGHYHVHTEMINNVSYVGSFSRWMHGEEEEKGFYQLFYDEVDAESKKSFVVNTEALRYVTTCYGYNSSVFTSQDEWEIVAKKLLKAVIARKLYRLRVIFNIPVGYENPEAFIKFFRDRFSSTNHINVEFSNGYTEKKITNAKKRIDDFPEEYKIFIDKNVPEEVKLSVFIKMKRGIDISPEVVKEYLETNG